MKRMPVIYIAGPYRGATESEVRRNIERARAVAEEVWRLGAVALCPHLNSAWMGGVASDEAFLEGDLELLRRCDAVVLVEGWKRSQGSQRELAEAQRLGLAVIYPAYALWTYELQDYLAEWRRTKGAQA